ncbi:hypothetical protein HYT23_01880 [Candidatus Pacearchaeota archaeon]|nr:hypothetical protein [Candidatus Pacearchaeota archaeon]
MAKLERLTQNEYGDLFANDGILNKRSTAADHKVIMPCGKIRTIIFENPVNIEEEMEKYAENYPASVPKSANAYLVSDFNGGTQKVFRDDNGKEHMLSVYAVQFYSYVPPGCLGKTVVLPYSFLKNT